MHPLCTPPGHNGITEEATNAFESPSVILIELFPWGHGRMQMRESLCFCARDIIWLRLQRQPCPYEAHSKCATRRWYTFSAPPKGSHLEGRKGTPPGIPLQAGAVTHCTRLQGDLSHLFKVESACCLHRETQSAFKAAAMSST